jgi:hypothetical protein
MAATVLVREVLRRVSILLNDSQDQFSSWPETDLVRWLDDAQLATVSFLPLAGSAVYAMRLERGVTLQSIERLIPARVKTAAGATPAADVLGMKLLEVVNNMGADGETPGDAIRIIDSERLDTRTPNWRTVRGTKVRSYTFDPQVPMHFEVTPAPPADSDLWVRIKMVAQPAKIPNTGTPGNELYRWDSGNTTPISVHDEHLDLLVNYVVARANLEAVEWASPTKAADFTNRWAQDMNTKVQVATGYNPNLSRLPFAPQPLAAAK